MLDDELTRGNSILIIAIIIIINYQLPTFGYVYTDINYITVRITVEHFKNYFYFWNINSWTKHWQLFIWCLLIKNDWFQHLAIWYIVSSDSSQTFSGIRLVQYNEKTMKFNLPWNQGTDQYQGSIVGRLFFVLLLARVISFSNTNSVPFQYYFSLILESKSLAPQKKETKRKMDQQPTITTTSEIGIGIEILVFLV